MEKKQEVIEALDKLLNDIAVYTDEHYDDEIHMWLMAATLRIWAGNKMVADEYMQILPLFKDQQYTITQVITAMDCAGDQTRDMDIPAFFRLIAEKDIKENTSHSRTVADMLGRFLVLPALINGDFTLEEANILREISDLLLGYCDYRQVPKGKTREYHPEMLTPLNKMGYYQIPLEKDKTGMLNDGSSVSEEVNMLPGSDIMPSTMNQQEGTPKINLTLNIAPEQPAKNESGIKAKSKKEPEGNSKETLEDVLEELNGLVGLDKVKNDVKSLMNFIKVCRMRTERGMKIPTISYHLVFTGNPGTGKTTVARMVAKLYYLLGILPQGQLVETDRSGLVAGYLGQTAIKTQKVIQEALGGVLFIDEAYALANDKEDSYGKEAIETLLKAMEDHREELVVIVAGYDDLMHKFIDSNPGLRSRFNKYFQFPDYDGTDLLLILKRFCDTNGYVLAEEAIPFLQKKLDTAYETREEHFGNARAVRNLFEHAINHQANRLVEDSEISDQELAELTLEDILPAIEVM